MLVTYFAYGASAITGVALIFFQKDALRLTPAEVAGIGFWLGLPWSMKMVAGVASDCYPIFGSRRGAYLLLGALCALAGYAALATLVHTRGAYLAAMLLITVGFMVQDVVADALSVQVAETEEEIGQIQTLGRMALLAGGISVGYLAAFSRDDSAPAGLRHRGGAAGAGERHRACGRERRRAARLLAVAVGWHRPRTTRSVGAGPASS